MNNQEKSWKDRMPPDGHLPASYEVQVCDEGNKTVALQMLDKAGIKYKISARKGQFYIQACDMQTFTQVKRVLDQSLDMSKEANHLGFPPEVTPIGTNTPLADVSATNVAVVPAPVKEAKELNEATSKVKSPSKAEIKKGIEKAAQQVAIKSASKDWEDMNDPEMFMEEAYKVGWAAGWLAGHAVGNKEGEKAGKERGSYNPDYKNGMN
jgi:hypothetical protein